MAGSGSAVLQLRIEQQQHWRLAAAVRDGRQPSVDPDSHVLRELRGSDRIYEAERGVFLKQVIEGAWSRVELP